MDGSLPHGRAEWKDAETALGVNISRVSRKRAIDASSA